MLLFAPSSKIDLQDLDNGDMDLLLRVSFRIVGSPLDLRSDSLRKVIFNCIGSSPRLPDLP